jgi:hypothetical protein
MKENPAKVSSKKSAKTLFWTKKSAKLPEPTRAAKGLASITATLFVRFSSTNYFSLDL